MAAREENESESRTGGSTPSPLRGPGDDQAAGDLGGTHEQCSQPSRQEPLEAEEHGDKEKSMGEEADTRAQPPHATTAEKTGSTTNLPGADSGLSSTIRGLFSSDCTLSGDCQAPSSARCSSSYPSCSSPSSSSQVALSASSSVVFPAASQSPVCPDSLFSEPTPPSASPLKREEDVRTPTKEGVCTPRQEGAHAQAKQGSATELLSQDRMADTVDTGTDSINKKKSGQQSVDSVLSPEKPRNKSDKPVKTKPSSSCTYGLWPEDPNVPTESGQPSLLHLAAACKKLTKESQAADFVATLSADDKTHLQRRYHRVARHIACLPLLRAMPQEKFRVAPRDVKPKKKEDLAELLEEQERQLRNLQPHDVVFAHLYPQLRELFPERADAALYEMCRKVCAQAKKENRKDVLAPLKRTLFNARFALAREQRKLRSHATAPEDF